MKSFVHVHTGFFVNERLADFDIFISVNNLSLFLQSFTCFYHNMGWHLQNKDLPLHFSFKFSDYPTPFPNKLIVRGVKHDIRLITYSNYINHLLSKLK